MDQFVWPQYGGLCRVATYGLSQINPGPNPGSTNGQIPRRAIYSSEEAELNKANLQEAVGRMTNGDSFLSKVWWDKKP